MKTLVVYNSQGNIIFLMKGGIDGEYKCLVTDIDENKEIIGVDTETNTVITKDKDTRIEDITAYLNSTDDETISKVEDTILKIETEKSLSEV